MGTNLSEETHEEILAKKWNTPAHNIRLNNFFASSIARKNRLQDQRFQKDKNIQELNTDGTTVH